MRIEATHSRIELIELYLRGIGCEPSYDNISLCKNMHPIPASFTATHGRVTATAPTMYEAIALCLNGVYQAKFIKSND